MSVTSHPNRARSIAIATPSTMGEEMRNENVIPSGTPAFTNPMNRGTAEHEQNGVGTPRSAAIRFPAPSLPPPSICLILCGLRDALMRETRKTIAESRMKTFIVS